MSTEQDKSSIDQDGPIPDHEQDIDHNSPFTLDQDRPTSDQDRPTSDQDRPTNELRTSQHVMITCILQLCAGAE